MSLILLAAAALAAAPPRAEVGRVHTSAGLAGPAWGLWGDLSVNATQRVAVRGGADLRFVSNLPPADLFLLGELQLGPYWLSPWVAGGAVLGWEPNRTLVDGLVPGWRAELGVRGLIRWGTGVQVAVATDGARVEGRVGGTLAW